MRFCAGCFLSPPPPPAMHLLRKIKLFSTQIHTLLKKQGKKFLILFYISLVPIEIITCCRKETTYHQCEDSARRFINQFLTSYPPSVLQNGEFSFWVLPRNLSYKWPHIALFCGVADSAGKFKLFVLQSRGKRPSTKTGRRCLCSTEWWLGTIRTLNGHRCLCLQNGGWGESVLKTAAGVSALQNGGWGGGVAPVAEPCHLPRHRAQAGSTQEAFHLEQLLL